MCGSEPRANPLPFIMNALRSLPLRRRLSLLIAFCAGLTALLCMLAMVGTGWWLQERRARDESTEVARVLSFALQAPVALDDRKGIADALALLRARPQVSGAWVYDKEGRLLASYGQGQPLRPDAPVGGFGAGYLLASEPITNDGQRMGQVVLVNELARLRQVLGIALLAIAPGSLAGFAVSVLLAQHITPPIATLATASGEIAAHHDYTQRLPPGEPGEVGTAVNAFNDMFDEIRSRGEALQEANRVLEQRVIERTLALQLEKERAEAASVAKTRFLASMSHELRTPLNAVIGAARLLHEGGEANRQAYLVDAIRSGGTRLLSQIENILDLSRIETGALGLSAEDFNLIDCVEAAAAPASVTAHVEGLEVACIVDPQIAAWRHGDPIRLSQVLLRLLGNAMKFTLQGEVVLRVERGDAPDGLRIGITDTGIGIEPALLAQVFEPFRQADDGADRRFGGTGLGLAISRQLVEAMGGGISVRSELGQGSTFEIELALPPAKQPGAEPPPLGHTVIYFEPNEPSAQALEALLVRIGCKAHRCRTPRALREWMELHATDPGKPWLLAAVDAEETWAFLEASIVWLDPERVIGMSTSESQEAEIARERIHVPRNVIKPVLRAALVSRFGAVTRAAEHVSPPGLMTAQDCAQLKHILVVEDDAVNQAIVCGMLERAGYLNSVAVDGASALKLLSRHSFDLVLMDWQMPDMDGLEVTRRLRAGAVGRIGKIVPIVALTANAFAEDRAACLAAGMNDFLTKPVLAKALQATMARWIGGAERSRPLAR
jgi:signal transduction histidine kinase/ActR/RegA family two-component response regulator